MQNVEVVAYFADDPTRVYQLTQWLPVLERLHAIHPVGVVLRDPDTAESLVGRTTLPVFLAPEFHELQELYADLDPKVAVYCNNGARNFNSLLNGRILHAHINHGESDKQCMVSNNAKAYDRVFVAGTAAVERHLGGLMEFDASKLVRIGRPQLDLRPEPLLEPTEHRTVLYGPTWEGDADYNNYTSVAAFGEQIVRSVLALPDVRLVYKPHPKVSVSETPAVKAAHQAILRLIDEAAEREPDAGHRTIAQGDILAVFPRCDAMITDVSSVGLDWLYLKTDRPIFITDPHGDAEKLRIEAAVSRCADVIEAGSLDGLTDLLAARLEHDEHHMARQAMRHHYFDDNAVGDSTVRFFEAVSELIAIRDALLGTAGDEAVTA